MGREGGEMQLGRICWDKFVTAASGNSLPELLWGGNGEGSSLIELGGVGA